MATKIRSLKPMLAGKLDGVDLSTLPFPLWGSPKIDGIRCLIVDGAPKSRTLKDIPNLFIRGQLSGISTPLDGELTVGSPVDPLCMQNSQTGVMTITGEPDYTYHVFDVNCSGTFIGRYTRLKEYFKNNAAFCALKKMVLVEQVLIRNLAELLVYEQKCIDDGWEGVMLRVPDGPYKYGRSTFNEFYLMKMKRFIDGEGIVKRIEEAMENTNVAFIDELGHTKRSSHKENMIGKGMIGTIVVDDCETGQEMNLAPGIMTHQMRKYLFEHPDEILKMRVHWRAFGYGVKDVVRFARYYGFREKGT